MFADGIKFEGAVTLHSQGNGPLTTLMAECRSQNLLRTRRQHTGLLPALINLEQGDFAHNLEAYFATSEQLPSRLFFASGDASVTGLLIQRMPVADDATEIELDEHEVLWSYASNALVTATKPQPP